MRDELEAEMLAAELGCEVIPHPYFNGRFDARDPAPGVWLLSGTPDEIRAEWRRAWLQHWLTCLGTLKRPRRQLLTMRERQVAFLVAEGLTNMAIAGRLVISVRTVDTHVQHILAKTTSCNRVGLANWLRDNLGSLRDA
jgi:DNA-binding CsgD family transcriptional regulator